VYGSDGKLAGQWTPPGEPSELKHMYLANDDSGYIYVANHRDEKHVSVFQCDASGAAKRFWDTGILYTSINGIAVHGNMLYVNTVPPKDLVHGFHLDSAQSVRTIVYRPVEAVFTYGLYVNPLTGQFYAQRSSLVFVFEFDTLRTMADMFAVREEGILAFMNDARFGIANGESRQVCIYTQGGRLVARFALKQNCADIADIKFGSTGSLYAIVKNAKTFLWEMRIYSLAL
jgi:hypothetical protein